MDKPFLESFVTAVAPWQSGDGWSVTESNGWTLGVPADQCDQMPGVGEAFLLYGNGFGASIRKILIGNRVYKNLSVEEQAQKDAKMRADLKAKHEQENEAFRSAPKEPLAPFRIKAGLEDRWAKCVERNSQDPYDYAVLRFTTKWAFLMEGGMEEEAAARAANEPIDITGFMYGIAKHLLAEFWEAKNESNS